MAERTKMETVNGRKYAGPWLYARFEGDVNGQSARDRAILTASLSAQDSETHSATIFQAPGREVFYVARVGTRQASISLDNTHVVPVGRLILSEGVEVGETEVVTLPAM